MSFDLMLLDLDLDLDTAPTAERIYEILDSDGPEAPLSVRIRALIDECSTRWPGEDDTGNWIEAPWASWPLTREAESPVIEVNIQWKYATAMLSMLTEIAARHGVVLFDPQTSVVHLPTRLT